MKNYITITMLILLGIFSLQGQSRQTLAVLSIDTKNFTEFNQESIADLTRIEIEKLDIYEVMDKYDMRDFMELNKIENCYGKICLVDVGKKLGVDYILTGSLDKIGHKIVLSLRLIDIKNESVSKSNIMEYLNMPEHIQKMIEISVKNIAGVTNDPNLVNMLANYDDPMNTPQTRLKLNGPRMGAAYISGDLGKRLMDPLDEGGWDAFPLMTQFGYQFETQYMSAGNFQGLFEYIFMISGLEQQMFNPSFIFMNGFRSNKTGWEIGFGPSLGFKSMADGYYDTDGKIGAANEWHLESDWNPFEDNGTYYNYASSYYDIVSRLDKRGRTKFSSGFVFSVGKTFRSGYLNIPVNVYASPKKSGTYIGLSIGFNVNKNGKPQ